MDKNKIIISAALTGAATNRSHCPAIPYTPEELGIEAKRAVDAGACIVHIHAREDNGVPSWRPEVFDAIHREVRKLCPDVIINWSTGAIGLGVPERTAHLPLTKPEMAAFNMGSMNYAIYSKSKKKFYWNDVFENSFDTMSAIVTVMNENDVCPEMECFDTGHIRNAEPLRDMGLIPDNACYSLVMGVLGGIPATAQNLIHQSKQVPDGAFWQSIVISRKQWKLTAQSAVLGGNIRVGLEDNFYLPNGEMAKSNGELVDQAVELVRIIGREPASIAEAREWLNIKRVS